MAKKKAELVEEAAAAGVEDAEELTVSELKDALAAPAEGHVHAEARDGVPVLVFGTVVPDEVEAGFEESHAHALSRDDALALAADLPGVVQAASAAATHAG